MLTLEVPKKRESESSRPIFRTDGRNLEGCVRETEISLQTESAAVWAGGTRKALETREKLGRNEKRPAVDLSTPGVKSFGRQSSYFDASSPSATLFVTILSLPEILKAIISNDLRSSRPVRFRLGNAGSNS